MNPAGTVEGIFSTAIYLCQICWVQSVRVAPLFLGVLISWVMEPRAAVPFIDQFDSSLGIGNWQLGLELAIGIRISRCGAAPWRAAGSTAGNGSPSRDFNSIPLGAPRVPALLVLNTCDAIRKQSG